MKKNLSIIGMAGVGKSFTSKNLADALHYEWVEIDSLITKNAERIGVDKNLLSDDEFLRLEEEAVSSLIGKDKLVIDTGGSVIYSPKAMKILNDISFIVYLSDSPEQIEKRFDERGEPHLIGMTKGMTFKRLLADRESFYEKYAHIKINVSEQKNTLVSKIIEEYKA